MRIRPGTTDAAVRRQVYEKRVYDVRCPVRPRLVLDLGAYTGISTRWFCDRYPDAEVIGVEPNPEHASLALQNAPDATIVQNAAWDTNGETIALRRPPNGPWADSLFRNGEFVDHVETVRVDTLLNGFLPDVVKMDVEGAETVILPTADVWMTRATLLHIETHDRYVSGCRAALDDLLRRLARPHRIQRRGGGKVDQDLAVIFEDVG